MFQINPSRDVLRSQFESTFSQPDIYKGEAEDSGELIFTKADVAKTTDGLAQMLRYIFAVNGITYQYLAKKYKEYALNKLGILPTKVSTGKGNLMSALHRPTLSFKKFYEVVVLILGYDIDMAFTLTDKVGAKAVYRQSSNMADVMRSLSQEEQHAYNRQQKAMHSALDNEYGD